MTTLSEISDRTYRRAKEILLEETGCLEPMRLGLFDMAPFLPHEYAQAATTLHEHGEEELRRQVRERYG